MGNEGWVPSWDYDLAAGISVVIPTHGPRLTNGMLARAIESVAYQATRPNQLIVQIDEAGAGAAATRTAGALAAGYAWTAFLDSDDWWYPEHLSILVAAAMETGADYVFSYFCVHDRWEAADPGADPLDLFGRVFDSAAPTQTTSTILVRTALVRDLGGFRTQPAGRVIPATGLRYGEDYDFTVRAVEAGARIVHVPARTWAWRMHPGNSSGLAGAGDAAPQATTSS